MICIHNPGARCLFYQAKKIRTQLNGFQQFQKLQYQSYQIIQLRSEHSQIQQGLISIQFMTSLHSVILNRVTSLVKLTGFEGCNAA